MPLIPFDLPGGVYKNGSRYTSKGRWREANLVRWVDGKVRAIGGWQRRTDISNDTIAPLIDPDDLDISAPRGAFSWRDNAGARYTAIGTTTKLFVVTGNGLVLDITPDDFAPGARNGGLLTGFGIGPFGADAFGTARTGAGLQPSPVGSWRFDTWGENLLAAGPLGATTKLFQWAPGDAKAVSVTEAPTGFADFCVTPERIVVLVGLGDDRRTVQWSTRENLTVWTPSTTNQAGSQALQCEGGLVAIVPWNDQHLIIGELGAGAFIMTYLGPPFVYGFQKVGEDCGCFNANSVITISGLVMWPTTRGFLAFDGSVKTVKCDIEDSFEEALARNEATKTYGFHLSAFNELWWLYQSQDSGDDVDRYVAFNHKTAEWMEGTIDRAVAVDAGVTSTVVMVDRTGAVFNHELINTLTGDKTPYAITGPIELGVGDLQMAIDYIYPDCTIPDAVGYRLRTRDMPNAAERLSPIYPATNPIPTRSMGREVALEIRAIGAAGWEVGVPRINVKQGGMR